MGPRIIHVWRSKARIRTRCNVVPETPLDVVSREAAADLRFWLQNGITYHDGIVCVRCASRKVHP